jgi:hypothetical protein
MDNLFKQIMDFLGWQGDIKRTKRNIDKADNPRIDIAQVFTYRDLAYTIHVYENRYTDCSDGIIPLSVELNFPAYHHGYYTNVTSNTYNEQIEAFKRKAMEIIDLHLSAPERIKTIREGVSKSLQKPLPETAGHSNFSARNV